MEAGIKQMTASRWAATYVLGYSYVARAPLDLGEGSVWELIERPDPWPLGRSHFT